MSGTAANAIDREKREVLAAGAAAGSAGVKDYHEARQQVRQERMDALRAQRHDQESIVHNGVPGGGVQGWKTIERPYDLYQHNIRDQQTAFTQDIGRGMAATAAYLDQAKGAEAAAIAELKARLTPTFSGGGGSGGGGGGGGGGRSSGGSSSSGSSSFSEADLRSYVKGGAVELRAATLKALAGKLAEAASRTQRSQANSQQAHLNSLAESIRAHNARPDSTTYVNDGGGGWQHGRAAAAASAVSQAQAAEAARKAEASQAMADQYRTLATQRTTQQQRAGRSMLATQARPMQQWGYQVMNQIPGLTAEDAAGADLTLPSTWSSVDSDVIAHGQWGAPQVGELAQITGQKPEKIVALLETRLAPKYEVDAAGKPIAPTPVPVYAYNDDGSPKTTVNPDTGKVSRVIESYATPATEQGQTIAELMRGVSESAAQDGDSWQVFVQGAKPRLTNLGMSPAEVQILLAYSYPIYVGATNITDRAGAAQGAFTDWYARHGG